MISHNLNKVTPGVGILIFQARQFLSDVVSSNYESVVSSHSRLRFVKSVQKHHHTQTSEGIDERCQQSHRRNQTSHNVKYVADESRHQQNRCQDHSNQRQKCCFVERHGRSISALRTFRNDRFASYRTVRSPTMSILRNTGLLSQYQVPEHGRALRKVLGPLVWRRAVVDA
jgi:hypothetical protein